MPIEKLLDSVGRLFEVRIGTLLGDTNEIWNEVYDKSSNIAKEKTVAV